MTPDGNMDMPPADTIPDPIDASSTASKLRSPPDSVDIATLPSGSSGRITVNECPGRSADPAVATTAEGTRTFTSAVVAGKLQEGGGKVQAWVKGQEQEGLQCVGEPRNMAEASLTANQQLSRIASEAHARSKAEEEVQAKAQLRGTGKEESQTCMVEPIKITPREAVSDTNGGESVWAQTLVLENSGIPLVNADILPSGDEGSGETSRRQTGFSFVSDMPNNKHKSDLQERKIGEKSVEMEGSHNAASTFCGSYLGNLFAPDEKEKISCTPQVTADLQLTPGSFASAQDVDPESNPTTTGCRFFVNGTSPVPNVGPSVGKPSPTEMESPSASSTGDGSLAALGSSKSKPVSSLVSKYLENAKKEQLAGDGINLQSSSGSIHYSPNPSPISPSSLRDLYVNDKDLPKIGSIRAIFEYSSKISQSNELLFGEAFRQKQRFSLLADKERKKEAKLQMHGASCDARLLAKEKQATGEIDTSSIEKSFSFQVSNQEDPLHDGHCKVDYRNKVYQGMVFVVHRTRGMLLLRHYDDSEEKITTAGSTRIPGGIVSEEEFLMVSELTGCAKLQLQLAARIGAARQLFDMTGIDIRNHLDRLTPAVLQMNPPVDEEGTQYLKNECENRIYYFLQIDDNDFVSGDSEVEEISQVTTRGGEPGSPLKLKLAGGCTDFTFIKDPLAAVRELNENGDPSVTTALSMVMGQSLGHGVDAAAAISLRVKRCAVGSSNVVGLTEGDEWIGGTTIIRNELAKEQGQLPSEWTDGKSGLNQKASADSAHEEVTCCCGFW